MMPRREGLALPAAILVLTVIGLTIAGTAFSALQESRSALGTLAHRAALEAAEYGATSVLRDWNPGWNTAIAIGTTLGPFTHALSGGAVAEVRVTRATATTWWVVSTGAAGGPLAHRSAHRRINAVYRLDVDADSAQSLVSVPDSVRIAKLAFAMPVRVRDRWWQEF